MYINELTDDYVKATGKFRRIFIGLSREEFEKIRKLAFGQKR